MSKDKIKVGTAGMPLEKRIEIARLGGLAVSRNRAHMSAIGKKGGKSGSADRARMSAIGKLGGLSTKAKRLADRNSE